MSERRYRVLIVDDSPEDQAWLGRALVHAAESPFECLVAATGGEGLARCRDDKPDCVVLDHRLPDMDALEFLAQLKEGRPEAPLAVVVLTGYGDEALVVNVMRAGAHDYLMKPAAPAEFERAIRSAIERYSRPIDQVSRILIIEDSPEDRAIYRRILTRSTNAFEFFEADTGAEGIALARQTNPDCVLLDYHLPDIDGLEVLTALMHDVEGRAPAVLMLTGQGNETVAVRALKAGAEDYLVKGPPLESLPQAVRSAIERVTLRRRIEEQRRELERHRNHLRVTLASIGDAVITTDRHGNVSFLNAVAETLTGWTQDEARGRHLEEIFVIINEESRAPVENPADRALREGVVVGLANHSLLIAKDGTARPIDDSAAPIRDEHGEVYGAVLVFRDVTDRRQSEQSLLLQSRVLESMAEGVSLTDDRGIIFYTNPAEDRMFGYERGEFIGQHITVQNDYTPEENERRLHKVIEHVESGGVWIGEWRNRRKDGSTFISYSRITTLDIKGRRCFVCVQEDITDRKRLEDELQQRVTELALGDKRKDQFLAMLAHELRNPLAPLRNAVHILKLKGDDWKTVEEVRDLMDRQVGHMGRLVDDLLDVSRITQGKVKLKLERLDLARLVRQTVADHEVPFRAGGIALRIDVPPNPLWVSGDATRLTQILDNLLTNALKFTGSGGQVTAGLQVADGRGVISLRDTGIGIAPDMLRTIFDVFAQADSSLDRSRGGLGLGLAIVKGLVELHGGAVTATSPGIGQGAEFTVSLPLEKEAPQAPQPRLGGGAPLNFRKILVVEDNRDAAESMKMLLSLLGFEVRLAHTGPEALESATQWPPDAVICDIGLPGMSGFEVARSLRQGLLDYKARLIALTGYGREEDMTAARAAGFDDFLVKPATPDEILEKIAGRPPL